MGVRGPGTQAAERAHVNDFCLDLFRALRAASFSAHPLQSFTRDQEWPTGVRREHGIPLSQGEALEVSGGIVGSVVDEDVDAAKFASGLFHHGLDAGFAGMSQGEGKERKAEVGRSTKGLRALP